MRQKGSTSDLVQTISKVPSTLKILNLLPDLVTAQISWVELLPLNLTLNTNLNLYENGLEESFLLLILHF